MPTNTTYLYNGNNSIVNTFVLWALLLLLLATIPCHGFVLSKRPMEWNSKTAATILLAAPPAYQQQELKKSSRSNQNSNSNIKKKRRRHQQQQLQWIVQGLEKMIDNNENNELLIAAMQTLANAAAAPNNYKNQQDIQAAGAQIEAWWNALDEPPCPAVRDRVVKAAAMTGLHQLALRLVVDDKSTQLVPIPQQSTPVSAQAQTAICSTLRRDNQMDALRDAVTKMTTTRTMNVVAYNIFLAALCDIAVGKETDSSTVPDRATNTTSTFANHKSRADYLAEAVDWLRCPRGRVQLDSVSYATVLQAAATLGEEALVTMLWSNMLQCNIRPNIIAYNARLRLVASRLAAGDAELMDLWAAIAKDAYVQPDSYTVHFMLLPLLRNNRSRDVRQMLDALLQSNDSVRNPKGAYRVSNYFGAFLLTLTQGGELESAHQLFDTYMLPALSTFGLGTLGSSRRLVKPSAKHFNILLDGYQKQIEFVEDRTHKLGDDVSSGLLRKKAWELYRSMPNSTEARPDAFTITTMMGICADAVELSLYLNEVTDKLRIDLLNRKSVLFRAAVTAFGKRGDVSSACWLYAQGCSDDTRAWNVLLGALAHSAKISMSGSIDVLSSNAAKALRTSEKGLDNTTISLFEGVTCEKAAQQLLRYMSENAYEQSRALARFDTQSFCLLASVLQLGENASKRGMEIFRLSRIAGIPADGRFVNSVLRCFGDDIKGALHAWKTMLRSPCLEFENRPRRSALTRGRSNGKNLLAAYKGLLYVAGRALRPDIALRIVYAMKKEGIEPEETSLRCYVSGKQTRQSRNVAESTRVLLAQKLRLVDSYESLLYVECMKYNTNDSRRVGEQRVRIIV
jgi:hypothetical protein